MADLLLNLLFIYADQLGFVIKHLIRQLEALDALELRVESFSTHAWIVSENALEHVFFCELEAVLMRYLTLNYAAGWCWTAVVIRPEQLQNLQMLPDLFLLLQKLLFQRFNLREFILLIVGHLFLFMGIGRLALSGILDFSDDHIDAFLLLVISTDCLQGTGLSRLLLDRRETAHVLARSLWRLGW